MPTAQPRVLHRPSGRSTLGLALVLATVVLWSVLPLGLKIVLAGLDAMTVTWVRFVAAALLLGALLRARGALPRLDRLDREGRLLLAVAAAGLAGNYALYALGLARTNAGTAQVVIQIAPMLLTFGGIFVFRETFAPLQWLGLGLLLAGLGLFSSEQIGQMVAGLDRYYAGLAIIVASGVSWAAYGLAQKQLLDQMGAPQIMLCIYAAGAVVFTPLATPSGLLELDGVQGAALAFCIVNMMLAYALFSEALAHVEASRVSAIVAVVPLGTLTAVHVASSAAPSVFPAEPLTSLGVLGASMVVAGSLVASLARR